MPHLADVSSNPSDSRKSLRLLSALDTYCHEVYYYAIDLSKRSLEDNMTTLLEQHYNHIKSYALWGDFKSAHRWLSQCHGQRDATPYYFCSFGSQFGNDYFEDAISRFKEWSVLLHENDRFVIGMDGMSDKTRLWKSYHDSEGLFEQYIRNGFIHSNRILKQEWYRHEKWNITGEMLENPTMHRFVLTADENADAPPTVLVNAEDAFENVSTSGPNPSQGKIVPMSKIHCYEAFKYGPEEMKRQFEAAGYALLATWKAPGAPYCELAT